MRDTTQDAQATALLRTFDRTVAGLFELGVNPFLRCTCWPDEPHSVRCPLGNPDRRTPVPDDLLAVVREALTVAHSHASPHAVNAGRYSRALEFLSQEATRG